MNRYAWLAAALLGLAASTASATEAVPDGAAAVGEPGAADPMASGVMDPMASGVLAPEAVVFAEPDPPAPPGFGSAVAAEALEDYRGGADVQLNEIRVGGTVHENSASNLETGSNFITEGAFTNTVGFPTTIQNSGNNVLIQNATIINVTPF